MPHHIDIEDPRTWPDTLVKVMSENKNLFVAYHSEEKRLDKLGREDFMLRIRRPPNLHKDQYNKVIETIVGILEKENIVGYHCTRLLDHEINNIKNVGMRMLTRELVTERLQSALDLGLLSTEQHSYISNSEILNDSLDDKMGKRTDYIWFNPNLSTLREGDGVFRFFQSWGGEAVYNGHEEDTKISPGLRSIGNPCIVKCSIPIADIDEDAVYLSRRFVSQFILDEIPYPHPTAGFDMGIQRNLQPSEVVDIIEISHPEFQKLTPYKLRD